MPTLSFLPTKVSEGLDPSWTALHSSRGESSPRHKLWMRFSVLAADALVFLPSAMAFAKAIAKKEGASTHKVRNGFEVVTVEMPTEISLVSQETLCFALLALYPGLILIDNGHFQYNNLSLGPFVASIASLVLGWDGLASVLFVLALNYKQMELYHALPIFSYLLGKCMKCENLTTSVIFSPKISNVICPCRPHLGGTRNETSLLGLRCGLDVWARVAAVPHPAGVGATSLAQDISRVQRPVRR